MWRKELSGFLSDRIKIFEELDKKSKKYIGIIIVGTLFLMCVIGIRGNNGGELNGSRLKRPEYGEASEFLNVGIQIEGFDEVFDTTIEILPRLYSGEEIEKIFEEYALQLPLLILKNNKSIAEVSSDLDLINEVEGTPITIEWFSSNYNLIDSDGKVNCTEIGKEGCEVALTALLKYRDYTYEKVIDVKVVEGAEYGADKLKNSILEQIQYAQEGGDEYLQLPKEIDGKQVKFIDNASEETPFAIFIMGVVAVIAVVMGSRKQKEREVTERKKQLSYDYSQMVAKLSLLIGAGMTVRHAWERIVSDYKRQGDDNKRYVYDEMEETYNQMLAGLSEMTAYEDFGRRCDVKEYMKFSTLLIQNMKKGSTELVKMLELEALEAFENRKNLAKKYGEEAGTKLLVPMIIMLIIVMVIIMVPALMSFQI